ncbi:hypothetical protein LO762_22720 [Actinocorallia sp. API 0066]|uniref:sirohydrochlorin chelatase n=1 Tax=Actinocorallia sp. API 0066 TaxID=2896846 RepID=UPI001E55B2C1|nr:hypothetical protein [Actinocorallia sp. API 0066]MCD0451983.1 hypothetical protein [Actinocorallia sp. API 0066]
MTELPDVTPDSLPTRRRAGRRGGRHRGGSFSLPSDSPAVVLTGAPQQVMDELADWIEGAHPGIPVHAGADASLGELVGDPAAVVVPLLLGPDPAFEAPLREGLASLPVLVSETLGPHPLLAEALHLRLAEAGLARADRIRMMSMVTAADGVVLGCRAADEVAEITSVLLASRLAVPVVAAPLHDSAALAAAAGALRANGAQRPALSPFVIDADASELAKAAADAGAELAAPLGGHASVAQLAVLRYVEALEALYTE